MTNYGPGSSPWNTSGYAFSPNTNVLNPETMPSSQAEAARQKSAAVMEALKNGDKGEADRLMGKNETRQGQVISQKPMRWLKEKFSKKDGKEGKVLDDGSSVVSEGVEREPVVNVMSKDGGKGDGIIR